jgi:hypothetical protein
MKAKLSLILLTAVLIAIGLPIAFRSSCACENIALVGRRVLRPELERALAAEEAFRAEHHAYALTLGALQFVPDPDVRIRLAMGPDSTLRVTGQWVSWPDLSCSLQSRISPNAAPLVCTR